MSPRALVNSMTCELVTPFRAAAVDRTDLPMITENIVQQLRELHLHGMADSLQRQFNTPEHETLRFEERMHLMIQNERSERANESFKKRLRCATLPIQNACLEELDPALPRQLDPLTLATVCEMGWITKHLNILITGPCGIGKSYIASALANAACRADHNVRCFKMPQLATQLARAHALQRRSAFLKALANAEVLLLDDLTQLEPDGDSIRKLKGLTGHLIPAQTRQ